jgi:rhamnosyltransferase
VNKHKLVSIIIRTKNEEKWISSCLKSVFNQDYENFEVIIVDNCSTDRTVKKAKEFPVKLISIKDFYPGKAINNGIKASSGEYIVCLSGHCIPVDNSWLKNLIYDLKDANVAGVYGRQEPLSFTSDLDKRDLLTVFGKDKKIQIKDSFFHNANSAFSRKIWKKFPFDENIENIEDRIWGELVIRNGYNIIYEPSSSVYHWHGINQDLNLNRAKNIVKILENISGLYTNSLNSNPKDLKILAVIPIKGNPLFANDKPLLERTLNSAKESQYITDIVVSTDSKKTAKIAKKLGAEVPFIRPQKLSEGYIDIFDVVEFTLDELEKSDRNYDLVVLLEETYPFRPKDLIDAMITKITVDGLDTVIAGKSEPRGVWIKELDKVRLLGSEKNLTTPRALKESQNIISLLGLCCVTHTASLRNKIVFSGKVGILEVEDAVALISANNKKDLKLISIVDENIKIVRDA